MTVYKYLLKKKRVKVKISVCTKVVVDRSSVLKLYICMFYLCEFICVCSLPYTATTATMKQEENLPKLASRAKLWKL